MRGVFECYCVNGHTTGKPSKEDVVMRGKLSAILLAMVLTGSAAGRRHIKGSIYGATKWFVHGYGGNMSEEMREWGGRCTVISPGMVDTPFFSESKPDKIKPEDVADAVMFALNQNPRAEVREVHIMPTN